MVDQHWLHNWEIENWRNIILVGNNVNIFDQNDLILDSQSQFVCSSIKSVLRKLYLIIILFYFVMVTINVIIY